MKVQDNILTTGTLFWIKAGHRGSVPIPLELLSEEQKETLSYGLKNNKYPLNVPSHTLKARYIWANEYGLPEVLVTNIDLSPEIKRKLRHPKKSTEKTLYRFTLSDMQRLQAELKSGVVDEEFVKVILSQPWRPWQSSEWKSMRDLKIQNSCENCGKTVGLVLQHTRQPRNIPKIIFELVEEQYEEFQLFIEQNIHEIDLPLPESTKKVPVCPKCGSSRVRHRIRKNNYICEKTRSDVICKYEFVTPEFGYDERDIQAAVKKRRSLLRNKFCIERDIYQTAIRIALEEIINYLNLDNTKTLCNKCAFIEDKPYNKLPKS